MAFRDSTMPIDSRNAGAAQSLMARVKGPYTPDTEARCALAIMRAQVGQVGDSRTLLEEARLIDPLSLMPYHLRLQLESQAGPPGEGDRWMRRHARIEYARMRGRPLGEDDVRGAVDRIQHQLGMARPFDAIDILEDFLVADLTNPGLAPPTVARLYHDLADLQGKMGERDASWRSRLAAVLLDPGQPEIVHGYLESLPLSLHPEALPDPTAAAYGVADPQLARELHGAGVLRSRVQAAARRLERLVVASMDVLEIGPCLPTGWMKSTPARSWVALSPGASPTTDGQVRVRPLDLTSVEEKSVDRIFVHDLPLHDPVELLATVRRGLRRGGRALVRLGPIWTSARGHGLTRLVQGVAVPDWCHLLWTPTQRETFAQIAQIEASALTPQARRLGAPVLLDALEQARMRVLQITPVDRSFPAFHVRRALAQALPHVENFHDWGFEALLEKP